jgi:hypothetical protein
VLCCAGWCRGCVALLRWLVLCGANDGAVRCAESCQPPCKSKMISPAALLAACQSHGGGTVVPRCPAPPARLCPACLHHFGASCLLGLVQRVQYRRFLRSMGTAMMVTSLPSRAPPSIHPPRHPPLLRTTSMPRSGRFPRGPRPTPQAGAVLCCAVMFCHELRCAALCCILLCCAVARRAVHSSGVVCAASFLRSSFLP